ncbi:hypothetical protein BDV96DRAFT_506000 [Lophiotrema nucula]|uniref:Multiple RNA-binding domain-containing protein 1 n=1 Tax=Lophiotrema nucula TaxID=690887 RepID=A0A6A5YN46_9PLEO|nr:hypothetical protein BDV96DRAFT_506000 [Lophiotrema nucula]
MESSRIFVRGLPPTFTEAEFRKHFAKYPVTDVKFFPQRRIGYVGYKTADEASKAVKYFNKSFIRMTRIYVELARPIADERLPKSRKQIRQEKTAPQITDYVPPPKEKKSSKRKREDDEAEQDPKLKEFLDVMQPPSKTRAWANEEAQNVALAPAVGTVEEVAAPNEESDKEYQTISKDAKSSKPTAETRRTAELSQTVPAGNKQEQKGDVEEVDQEVGEHAAEENQGPMSDMDWLRSRTKRTLELETRNENTDARQNEEMDHQDAGDEAGQPAEIEVDEAQNQVDVEEATNDSSPSEEDKIRENGRLYLRNLSYDISEVDLREHFLEYGQLEEVHVPIIKSTGAGKGFAFLQFSDPAAAVSAYLENDGKIFRGRLLHVISARVKKDIALDEFAISKLPLKEQRKIKKKADAASTTFNWNSLYLNADAVMSTVANRLGLTKAELLDPTSSDAAVKQAHAETHIIQETKSYFAQNGVDLDSFKRSAKGDTAILVKNIPHATSADEVKSLFTEHGTITKFLMPPAGLSAVIEFSNAAQAKSAFQSLAYRKVRDSVLFLEKAPKDFFKAGVSAAVITQSLPADNATTKLSAKDLLQDAPPSSANTATLYVRNLNFSTTTDRLRETFAPLSGFRSAKVKTKVDPKRGVLSMGFGFVEFDNAESAASAAKVMDGYSLEGYQLTIRASHKGADAAEERRQKDAAKSAASTKIIVKNLPFEASKKDLRALFAPYGQLRSVRVPKKFDAKSRGFGFCEFTTKREASAAMEALSSTHLLGRRLVLAFAEAESDDPEKELEKMQQKVGSQTNKVALQRLTGGGRKKFNVAGNEDLDEG